MNVDIFLVGSQILEHATNSSNTVNRKLIRNKDFVVSGETHPRKMGEVFPPCRSQDASADVQLVIQQVSETLLHAINMCTACSLGAQGARAQGRFSSPLCCPVKEFALFTSGS